MILLPLNEIVLNLPNVPVSIPLYVAPIDSAASSTKIAPCLLITSFSSSILPGVPYRCAITTTLVSGYNSNAFSSATGSIFQVSYSVSMNTGSPPSYTIGFTVASKVISEQNTFLPSNAPCPTLGIPYAAIPASFIDKCKDAVPHDKATACLQPIYSQTILSTSLIFLPTVDIQFVS